MHSPSEEVRAERGWSYSALKLWGIALTKLCIYSVDRIMSDKSWLSLSI
jgi:hypothetical protein